MGALVSEAAFDKTVFYIESAKQRGAELLCGGTYDKSIGYFVSPTVFLTDSLDFVTMREEIFGPVLTCYVYEDQEWESVLKQAADDCQYGLTAGFFATSRTAISTATRILRHAAGNLYINDKCTGAMVGAQPFGGSRHSGTNDKAGSYLNLLRWTSPRCIKENFIPLSK